MNKNNLNIDWQSYYAYLADEYEKEELSQENEIDKKEG